MARRKPKMKLTASQEKEWKRYQRDAAALGMTKRTRPRKHKGAIVNETLPLPKLPHFIDAAEHPKDDRTELRCMICGAWYRDHRAGEFLPATFSDGVELVQNTARSAGDESGGYLVGAPCSGPCA